ncbi:flagellar export chaperone FliS [Algicola sagamiensis]|uniref:flagellar export chaperone FliS n=1 Tax=Algicola sagamiensis TaxID=163869 RepID=UPI000363D3B3|nr:flagellar export chaperone FliS [Algicola sagamiensis]
MQNRSIKAYQKDNIRSELSAADPHRIIQMLMQGALERLAQAKGAIERKDLEAKSQLLSKVTAILHSLRGALDFEVGGELAQNLDGLYEYMINRVMDASINLEQEPLDEVMALLVEIKGAWDAIPVSAREEAFEKQAAASGG